MCKDERLWNPSSACPTSDVRSLCTAPFEAVNPTKQRKFTILYVHIVMHVGNTSKMYEPLSLVVYTHLLSEYWVELNNIAYLLNKTG